MAKKASKDDVVETADEAVERQGNRFVRYCLILGLTGLVALAWLSMLTYSPTDWPARAVYPAPASANGAGHVGAFLAYSLRYWLGGGSYMLLLFGSVAAAFLMLGGRIKDVGWRILGVLLLTASTSTALHLLSPAVFDPASAPAAGVLGHAAGTGLLAKMGTSGSWLVVLVGFGIGLMFAAESLVLRLPGLGRNAWARRDRLPAAVRALRDRLAKPEPAEPSELTGRPRVTAAVPTASRPPQPKPQPVLSTPADEDDEKADEPKRRLLPFPRIRRPAPADDADGGKARGKKAPGKPAEADGGYAIPSADLLADPAGGYIESQEVHAAEKRVILQEMLDNFRVDAQVVGYMTGPVITLFEISLAAGVKVSQVASLSKDIARAMAVQAVRIVSPLEGRDTIGVEVPNPEKEIVRIKELMGLAPEAAVKMSLPLYLGKDAGGDPIVADLGAMPHMLIAGTTGSGKSVCINTIIMSLLLTRTPDDVRFILADPKMVEMAAYESIPHLLCPIVNDMRRAEDILEWAATKMDERYELLKDAHVRNLAGFNSLTPDEICERFGIEDEGEKAKAITHMPHYVIIIDELADLMMTSGKEVEGHIIRIAQKARAVGIHLVLATQRPSVNVVTGLIKSNMPCRASFRVASRQESRIVLDQNGADVLLGQGDMLFLPPGVSTLIRAQGTYVDDNEIKTVVKELKKFGEPKFNVDLLHVSSAGGSEGDSGERDELFDQAVEIVLESKRGSVSLLQRRLGIGYTRSARIIDQMADAGILGDYKGSQARECMMTLDQWHDVKASMAADLSGASAANGEPTSV